MLVHGVVLALVPWLLDSSELIYGRRSRPIPGQDRRGEPVRPVARAAITPAKIAHTKAAHSTDARSTDASLPSKASIPTIKTRVHRREH